MIWEIRIVKHFSSFNFLPLPVPILRALLSLPTSPYISSFLKLFLKKLTQVCILMSSWEKTHTPCKHYHHRYQKNGKFITINHPWSFLVFKLPSLYNLHDHQTNMDTQTERIEKGIYSKDITERRRVKNQIFVREYWNQQFFSCTKTIHHNSFQSCCYCNCWLV